MAVSVYAHPTATDRAFARINITPLVDVLLVLLVIFMVTAPMLSRPLPVRLPQAGPRAAAPPPHLALRVTAAGEYLLDGRSLAAAELAAALRMVALQAPATVLEIDSAGEGDYQAFATALGTARASGLENIALTR